MKFLKPVMGLMLALALGACVTNSTLSPEQAKERQFIDSCMQYTDALKAVRLLVVQDKFSNRELDIIEAVQKRGDKICLEREYPRIEIAVSDLEQILFDLATMENKK